MTTNGLHIPDTDKIEIPEEDYVTEEAWVELTNSKGDDDE